MTISTKDQNRIAAHKRLDRYATQRCLWDNPNLLNQLFPDPSIASAVASTRYTENLEVAAKVALRGIQKDLLEIRKESSVVEPRRAKELMTERFRAITALIELYGGAKGNKLAKEKLLELTGGAPLTICMGDPQRIGGIVPKTVQTDAGEFPYTAKGCLAIMLDSTQTDRPMWPALCDKCQKAWRTEERALRRLVKVKNLGRAATVYQAGIGAAPVETSCPTPVDRRVGAGASRRLVEVQAAGELANLVGRVAVEPPSA